MLFTLGRVCATPGVLRALGDAQVEEVGRIICRHIGGDWGELDQEDCRTNNWSVRNGARILSAYTLSTGVKVWVITEADRSATTILLPEEY